MEECSKTVDDTEPQIGEMREKVKLLEDRKTNEKDFQVSHKYPTTHALLYFPY